MKPVAYRQMSSKWHCWVFEENRGDLRPDDEAEGLVLQSDAQMLLEALQGVLAAWDRLYPSMPVGEVYEDVEFREMQAARASIARATAQQPDSTR